MERLEKRPTNNVIVKNNKISITTILENIQKEYSLKRTSFFTPPISPNLFMGKLELRMKMYYKDLYKKIN